MHGPFIDRHLEVLTRKTRTSRQIINVTISVRVKYRVSVSSRLLTLPNSFLTMFNCRTIVLGHPRRRILQRANHAKRTRKGSPFTIRQRRRQSAKNFLRTIHRLNLHSQVAFVRGSTTSLCLVSVARRTLRVTNIKFQINSSRGRLPSAFIVARHVRSKIRPIVRFLLIRYPMGIQHHLYSDKGGNGAAGWGSVCFLRQGD